jgi:hypothetical protein
MKWLNRIAQAAFATLRRALTLGYALSIDLGRDVGLAESGLQPDKR